MARRYRILSAAGIVVALALVSLAIALSHDSSCPATAPAVAATDRMQAVVYRCYGPPDVLQLEALPKPTPADNEVLVKVHAAALNPLDWHYMRGKPYFMRLGMGMGMGSPTDIRMGVDFAGTVQSVGSKVSRFKPGDEVFGGRSGALAEYVSVREAGAIALKPANLTFEQAAAVPLAAITALQAIRNEGRVQPGQKVLVNGASGGVGTFAVQIAKAYGAEVSGVCSTRNLELVRSLGADHVFDYTKEDFTQSGQQFDVIVDNVGTYSLSAYRRVLKPAGKVVMVGAISDDPWIGPMIQPLKGSLYSPFVSQTFSMFLAEFNQQDMEFLGKLVQEGKMTPVIDRTYALADIAEAMHHLEAGHARGKVVVKVE